MSRWLLALGAAAAAAPTLAQHVNHDAQHAGHDAAAVAAPEAGPPPAALSGPAHAADSIFDPARMAAARAQLRAEHGDVRTHLVLADRLETAALGGDEAYRWDLQGWYGGDYHKLWVKTEGAGAPGDNPRSVEVQALWSRAVMPFFDFQAGVRRDFRPSPERTHLMLGMQGLLPGRFAIEGAAFIAEGGDVTARFEGEYDVRITQRLILQPRVELDFAAQTLPALGVGSGLGAAEAGLRLRYEVRRELAPYVGLRWTRKVGETADLARAAGEDPRDAGIVLGVRAWF
ncbi:MAG TPA: copper resistance protein B [Gammaproteobacteria bacterium]